MKQKLLLLSSFCFIFFLSKAQLNYSATNYSSLAGTYTDLGATGTVITTNFTAGAMTFDDDNSSVQNIGFTFNFNGTAYTQFVLNTNGFIKLGAAAPSAINVFYSTFNGTVGGIVNATDNDVIYPFNHDLQGGTSPEFRVLTSGTVPNRTCTIQYKNMADKIGTTQYANQNFQIILYETSGTIDFVFGTWTANGNASAFNTAATGIKGTGIATSINLTKGSTQAWSLASALTGNYTGNAFNYGNGTRPAPDAGRTYKFLSTFPNDANVAALYGDGKIAIPFNNAHTVSSVIVNNGSAVLTNLPVTLTVSGSNTFSNTQNIVSLAAGASATVTFLPYTSTNFGTNTLTVSVPADDLSTNNTRSLQQEVVNNGFSFSDNSAASPTGNVGYNTGSGIFMIRQKFVSNPVSLSAVKANIATGAAGNIMYGVICDAAGAILAASPNYTILPGDIGTNVTFTFTTPIVIAANTDFHIGVAQTANAVGYFPLNTQIESPGRPNSYWGATLTGATLTNYTTLNRYMIEGVIGTTLPITLTTFNGNKSQNSNLLTWTTTSETNNKGFYIERSFDGIDFKSIGFISSKANNGNATSSLNYEFNDFTPSTGTNYYRLKQTDKDGKYTHSSVVTLKGNKLVGTTITAIYPNPVKDKLTITIGSPTAEKASLVITDLSGKIVRQKNISLINGEISIFENIGSFATGTYLLKLVDEKGATIETKKIVKQ